MEYIEFSLDDLDIRECEYDLTIGMIVKNEEKILEECLKGLEPLRKLINCELIITDTGSTDKTVEIAEQYADKVLHFEWCDDFSAARNTCVEASEGSWFMFVDADEVFDKSIEEIANFINAPNRDEFDNATLNIRNIINNDKNKYNDFRALRLFNFTKNKRYFCFKIHETIPRGENITHVEAIAWHMGYSGKIFDEKRVRNRNILVKELQKNPNNIRYMKQIIDVSENEEEKLFLADKAFTLFKNNQAEHSEVVLSIYNYIARMHYRNGDNDKVIQLSDEFFQIKTFEQKSFPFMEMAWVRANAFFNLGKMVDALRMYELYKSKYEYLSENDISLYSSIDIYRTNKITVYNNACLLVIECLRKIGEVNKANRLLEGLDSYKFRNNDKDCYLLNLYLNNVIMLNNKKLFNEVESFVNRVKIDVYADDKYALFMIAKMHFNNDITDYVKKCEKDVFINNFLLVTQNIPDLSSVIQKHFIRKTKFVNLKECEYYTETMYYYCFHLNKALETTNKNEGLQKAQFKIEESVLSSGLFAGNHVKTSIKPNESVRIKNQINEIFVLLVKYNYEFLNKIQNINELKNTGFDNIDKMQAMVIIAYEGFQNKETDVSAYRNALTKSIPYGGKYTGMIKLAIDLID